MGFKRCTESPLAYHWHASESADLSPACVKSPTPALGASSLLPELGSRILQVRAIRKLSKVKHLHRLRETPNGTP